MTNDLQSLAADLIQKTKSLGASAAEVLITTGNDQSLDVRNGKIENTERSENCHLGIRAFIGQKVASVSTSDSSQETCERLCKRVVDMAHHNPENPYIGLADQHDICTHILDLDLVDSYYPTTDELFQKAFETEQAGLATAGITNTEGVGTNAGLYTMALATSNGFNGSYQKTVFSVSGSLIAGQDTAMQRDYDYSCKTHWHDLENADDLGKNIARRTLSRLNPRKIASGKYPVIFDKRISSSLLHHFEDAICGTSIARKTSFLLESIDTTIFNSHINIIDNPHLKRRLGSHPFDGEGYENHALELISKGVLNHYLLDYATSKQLKAENTRRSKRGTGSPSTPSATNLYMENGNISVTDMMKNMGQGLLITELIGFGVNEVTGDYSRGAGGFWIENGEIAYPVSEITLAGNLKDMFKTLLPANDLEFKARTNSPSIMIEGLTIAGS